ncbi:MAG: SAM-dependent methyltransferase [Thermomicrobiales bacterium]|nr:MAG: SAM-dependent methyltransferase [Thermomicrobiales bacterium]
MTNADAPAISQHYGRSDLGEAILAAVQASGKDPHRLTTADLAPATELHTGGQDATRALARLAGLRPGMRVLDAGGGLGGPARTLASEFGCDVTVLDLTEAFCRVGAMLTERTGLGNRVSFLCGDALAMPLPDHAFDVVWTQHSSMNIAGKEQLITEIHRVLRPGGVYAMHEIVAGPAQPIHFPVPWARTPAISFLLPAGAVRALVRKAGFDEMAWIDLSAPSLEFFWRRLTATPSDSAPPLGLHLLVGSELDAMLQNMKRNLEENRIAVIQGVFRRR